ncbi:unnamed protein product [Ectocarpus fasciculatus]
MLRVVYPIPPRKRAHHACGHRAESPSLLDFTYVLHRLSDCCKQTWQIVLAQYTIVIRCLPSGVVVLNGAARGYCCRSRQNCGCQGGVPFFYFWYFYKPLRSSSRGVLFCVEFIVEHRERVLDRSKCMASFGGGTGGVCLPPVPVPEERAGGGGLIPRPQGRRKGCRVPSRSRVDCVYRVFFVFFCVCFTYVTKHPPRPTGLANEFSFLCVARVVLSYWHRWRVAL